MLRLEVLDYVGPAQWRWRLTDDQGKVLADHPVELDEGEWQFDAFADLHRYLQENAAPDRRLAREAELVIQVGAWLGERVLGPIGLELARAHGPVLFRVPAEAADLTYRPWELAIVENQPLVAHQVSFVIDHRQSSVPKDRVGDRLRMLAVFSGAGSAQHKERFALARAVHDIGSAHNKAVELRVLPVGATREQLRLALLEPAGWDVVHLSGHGLTAGLVLADGSGGPDALTSADLVDLLDLAVGQLKLVTLFAAESAEVIAAEQLRQLRLTAGPIAPDEPDEALPALASELVRQLDCAVLTMRYPVVDDFAIALAQAFYNQALGNGQPVGTAMAVAVTQVAGGAPTPATPPLSVATPMVLGARAAQLRLAAPSGEPLVFQAERQRLAEFPPQPARFVGRTGLMTRAAAVLGEGGGRSGVVLHGMAGAGKTTCALELAYTSQESFVGMAWYVAPLDGDGIESALTDCALALERQLPGLRLANRANDMAAWRDVMPALTDALTKARVLIVLDNVESLLTDAGEWRDEGWALFARALTDHQGPSRVVITSRRRPAGLPETVADEQVHALSLTETVLLAREFSGLRALMEATVSGLGAAEARDLAARTVMVVQGHPELIELAERRAADPMVLQARLDEADRVWEQRGTRLEPFLAGEDAAATVEDYQAVLTGWTSATASSLSPDSALLFDFLCCLEPDDRGSMVVHAEWPRVWGTMERTGDAPEPDTTAKPLVEQGLVAVDVDPATGGPQGYRIHPGVAESGRGAVDAAFRDAVDNVVGDGWLATLREAMSREDTEELGQWMLLAARSAAPYLLRQHRWLDLDAAVEQVLHRDRSSATAVALLPVLAAAVTAAEGTEQDLAAGRTHARALAVVDPEQAEPVFGALLDTAVAREQFRQAAVIAGDLITMYRDSALWDRALALTEAKADYSARAGLGPWTRLGDDSQRLQLLGLRGSYQEVLDAVDLHRAAMATMPDPADAAETVAPWNVREVILGIGVAAARELGAWQQALELNAAIRQSKQDRDAGATEVAGTRFNDCGPLLGLGRVDDVRDLLHECHTVFENAHDYGMLAKTLIALADVEGTLGHSERAVGLDRNALRLGYVVVDPEGIAVGHHNLGAHLTGAEADLRAAWAHLLAAAVIRYQIGSGGLGESVQAVAGMQASAGSLSFDEMCSIVDDDEGIHFAALFGRLPARADTGDGAVEEVLRLATELRSGVIAQTVDVWEPIVSAVLAVRRSSADLAAADVDQLLSTAEQQPEWQELVPVLRRIQAGEDDPALVDNLNPVDTAIVRRALDALAGTADVDPAAWRQLTEAG